jgi:hypothetical protein
LDGLRFPLYFIREGLKRDYGGFGRDQPTLFVVDPDSPLDLIDFWNSRLSHSFVLRRRLAALARPTQTWPRRRFADWSVRSGAWNTTGELLAHIERNQGALVHYAARRRNGEPISTAFVESSVNEIIAKRMNKKQQMRWNRATVQPFLDVRTAVLNDTLADAFRHRYPGFRPANDAETVTLAS